MPARKTQLEMAVNGLTIGLFFAIGCASSPATLAQEIGRRVGAEDYIATYRHVFGGMLEAVLYLTIFLAVYFAPYLVARKRGHHNRTAIGVLNLVSGWTIIGWLASLIWALTNPASSGSYPQPVDKA